MCDEAQVFTLFCYRNGRNVSAEENKLFVSMFKYCEGGKSIKEQFYMKEDEESNSVYGLVYQNLLMAYCKLVRGFIPVTVKKTSGSSC